MMAARIAQKGGSFETSRMIWSELYESTNDPNIKKNALTQIESLKAQEDEMHLDESGGRIRETFRPCAGEDPGHGRRGIACGHSGRSRRDSPTFSDRTESRI